MCKFKLWIFLLVSNSFYALTTLNVTISTDNNPGGMGELGDLRYTLNSMNQGLNTTPDDYAIVFNSPMTIQLNGILPIINNSASPVNITIGNQDSTSIVTIDGNNGAYSGFFIPTGNVTIQNMIFQNLTAKGGNGGDGISGGGGGGGLGSRATIGTLLNLGHGGLDQSFGSDGSGYGLSITAGSGGGGLSGGSRAGGGGGSAIGISGGGGSAGTSGIQPQGSIPPLQSTIPSGGNGGDGAGGGGGGVVITSPSNEIDGQAGGGGYGGGGGGGAGTGGYDSEYTVQGAAGGVGGGGGGGGVNQSGTTSAEGGNSLGGGGGGGGGPSNGLTAAGGTDTGSLGGGTGGSGANNYGSGFSGGGGGGGSGLGGAIFIDTGLNLTIEAMSGIPTTFNTTNNTTQAGAHGTGSTGATDGLDGSALGNSIFLRSGSSLTLSAPDTNDLLTLGSQVGFTDDTSFGLGGTSVFVRGNGTIIYNGTTDYQGNITINNANLKVNGQVDQSGINVCRNSGFSSQRGTLSGTGTLTGNVYANSGTIAPDAGSTLTLGGLTLNAASGGSSGSLVHSEIDSNGTSLVAVTGAASLAGTLEINVDQNTAPGQYTLLTSSGITGTFDNVTFTGATPNYTLSYLPQGAPTYVAINIINFGVDIPATVNGSTVLNSDAIGSGRPIVLGPLPLSGSGPTTYRVTGSTGNVQCRIGTTATQTYLKMFGTSGTCTIVGTKNGTESNPLTVTVA